MQRVKDKHRAKPPPMPFKVRGDLHSRLKELEEKMEKGEATTTSPVDLVEEYFDHGVLLEPFTVEESRTGFKDPASRAEVLEAWLPQDGLQRAPVKLNVQVRPHFSSATPADLLPPHLLPAMVAAPMRRAAGLSPACVHVLSPTAEQPCLTTSPTSCACAVVVGPSRVTVTAVRSSELGSCFAGQMWCLLHGAGVCCAAA